MLMSSSSSVSIEYLTACIFTNMILFQIIKTVLITDGSYIKISRKYKHFFMVAKGTVANKKLFHIHKHKQTLSIKKVSLYM